MPAAGSGARGGRAGAVRAALPFLAPMLLLVGAVIVVPVLGTLLNSAQQDTGLGPPAFIGITNFRALATDPAFYQSLRFTLAFIALSVPLEMALGLMFALVLHQRLPGRGLLRACVLVPWAVPAAIAARTWELIYNYDYGLANFLVTRAGLADGPVNWLGTGWGAVAAVVVADAWKTAPFVAIILLAGLAALPEDVYAQARVDGANFLQRFTRITLPLLRPVLIVALVFRTIDALRVFDLLFVITQGGPGGATTSLSLYASDFFLAGDFGYGSAVSVVLFVIAFALSVVYVTLGRFQVEGV